MPEAKRQSWYLLGDAGPAGEELPLFVDWAIRAIEAPRWAELVEGPARGMVKATIAAEWRERVGEWIERDREYPGSTARASFDCVRCAACCYDNHVVLDKEDLGRWRSGARSELLKRTTRRKGVRVLPLVRATGACVHLGAVKKNAVNMECSIYIDRPNMCRDFPAGTEQCLTSREERYGSPFPKGR